MSIFHNFRIYGCCLGLASREISHTEKQIFPHPSLQQLTLPQRPRTQMILCSLKILQFASMVKLIMCIFMNSKTELFRPILHEVTSFSTDQDLHKAVPCFHFLKIIVSIPDICCLPCLGTQLYESLVHYWHWHIAPPFIGPLLSHLSITGMTHNSMSHWSITGTGTAPSFIGQLLALAHSSIIHWSITGTGTQL